MSTKKSIYFADAQEQFLGEVNSGRVNQLIDRYSEILRRERIDSAFSDAEWSALRDMLNGTSSEPAGMIRGSLALGWEDSIFDKIDEKWGVDPSAMLEKLRGLSYAQEVAVIEAVQAWWRAQANSPA